MTKQNNSLLNVITSDLNRPGVLSAIEAVNTEIYFGFNITPLVGAENYVFGGCGDFYGQFAIDNQSLGFLPYTYQKTDLTDVHPFLVNISEGAGRLNGKEIVNGFSKTFAFNKSVSTTTKTAVDDLIGHTNLSRTFQGCPFQILMHVQECSEYEDLTKGEQTVSVLTPDDAVFRDDYYTGYFNALGQIIGNWPDPVNNYDSGAVAFRWLRPGMSVKIYAEEFSKSGSVIASIDYLTEVADAKIAYFHPIQYMLVPAEAAASIVYIDPYDMDLYLREELTSFSKYRKLVTVFAVFYHRFEFKEISGTGEYYNFGHILEPDSYSVDEITDGSTPIEDVTILKHRIEFFLGQNEINVRLSTDDDKIVFDNANLDAIAREMTKFHILPNVAVMTAGQKAKYFPGYPEVIKTPVDVLHYPYAEKVNSVEAISAVAESALIDGADVPHPDYFSIDLASQSLDDIFIDIDSVMGVYAASEGNIYWYTKNDEHLMARQKSDQETYRYGENLFFEYSARPNSEDPQKFAAVKGLSKNIEAVGIATTTLTFASETERDHAKTQFALMNGPFIYVHNLDTDYPTTLKDFNDNQYTFQYAGFPWTSPAIARVFDWVDGDEPEELVVAYAQITCIDTYNSSSGSVTNFYTHQFNYYHWYLDVAAPYVFFYDGRTDSSHRYHDIVEDSAGTSALMASATNPVKYLIDAQAEPQIGRGTQYWAAYTSGRHTAIEPIFPHSPLFIYTMPALVSGDADDRRSRAHTSSSDITINGYGKVFNPEHEIVFNSLADALKTTDAGGLTNFTVQMNKTKEAFGIYFENITGPAGYHVVSKFNTKFDSLNSLSQALQNQVTEVPFLGFGYDALSSLLDSTKTEGWHGYVKLNYDVWLPVTVHFYVDENNEISYTTTDPGMLSSLDKIVLPGVLYIGSCHIPPEGWHGHAITQQNLPEKVAEFYRKSLLAADSARADSINELQCTHLKNVRTGMPTAIAGTDTEGVQITLETKQHRFDNPYALDLFLLQPEDQRDNFSALYGGAFSTESDPAKPNTKLTSADRDNQEISQETFPTIIHSFNSAAGDIWVENQTYLQRYEYDGKQLITLKPIGQIELVETGDYRNYTDSIDSSYIDTDHELLKLRHMYSLNDGMLTTGTSIWDHSSKLYDTCRNGGFGSLWTASYKKMQSNSVLSVLRCESEMVLPLSRIHFASDAEDYFTSRRERVNQRSTQEEIDSRAARYFPVISWGNNSNDALSRQNYRKSALFSDAVVESSNGMGFFSFGKYTVPLEAYCEMFPSEIHYSGSDMGERISTFAPILSFAGIPIYVANDDSMLALGYSHSFATNYDTVNAIHLWANKEWADIPFSSQSGSCDAMSDYLQSFMPAGRHLAGVLLVHNTGTPTACPTDVTYRMQKNGDKWKRTENEFEHIFSSVLDPHFYGHTYLDITDPEALIESVNDQNTKERYLLPRVSQTYVFEEDHILSSFKISFANTPWVTNVFDKGHLARGNSLEKIVVYFGYTINGKVDIEGFVHTEFIEKDDMNSSFVVEKTMSLPLYVKGGKEFFVGILHVNHSADSTEGETPALLIKTIHNGKYSAIDGSLLPFPPNAEAMIVEQSRFTDRALKIDLRSFIYQTTEEIDSANRSVLAANVSSSRSSDYYKPTRISRFLFLDDPIVPEDTEIDYFWSDGSVSVINPFYPGKEIRLPSVVSDFSLRAAFRTVDKNVSPIFRAGTSPMLVLHEPLRYDVSNTHEYSVNGVVEAENNVPFSDLSSYFDAPATCTMTRPFPALEEFSRDFFERNFNPYETFQDAFWNGIEIPSDRHVAVNGSVLEIELGNMKSSNQYIPIYIDGVRAGFLPFGLTSLETSSNGTAWSAEGLFQAHVFRLQFDFYDPSFDPRTMGYKDVPFELLYKQTGYRSFESQCLNISSALPAEELTWNAAIAYPFNYCYQGSYLESPGVLVDIRRLENNWFRQTVEFIPVGYEFDFNHTVMIVNAIHKELPLFNFTIKPRVLWPLEDYHFLLRIGVENLEGATTCVKNVKTSFDTIAIATSTGTPAGGQLLPIIGIYNGYYVAP